MSKEQTLKMRAKKQKTSLLKLQNSIQETQAKMNNIQGGQMQDLRPRKMMVE